MTEDDEITSTKKDSQLVAYWLMLTGFLTNRRKKNLADIMQFLQTEISVSVRPDKKLFVDILWFEQHKSLFNTSIFIAFNLTKEIPSKKTIEELGKKATKDLTHFNYEVGPGTSEIGEQIFYFTLSDFERIDKNKSNLELFITKEYQTEEEIRAENKFYSDELREFDRSRNKNKEE